MSLHHNPRIVTSGLVLALDAADANSYPGSGTTWKDLSGNGYDAESQVDAATTEGKFNAAGFFEPSEASDLHFLVAGLNNYNFNPAFSINFWIKNTGGDYRAVFQNSDMVDGASDSIDIRFGREDYYGGDNNGTKCGITLNSDNNERVDFFVPLNVWTNVHCSYNGASLEVYTNGILFDSLATSITVSQVANDVKLFRHYTTGEDLVNPFANLRVYNRALSADEIIQNYEAQKQRFA